MKNYLNILGMLFFSVVMQSCVSPDKQEPCEVIIKTNNLTDFQKTRCPYTGNDTLIFMSNQNDTAFCYTRGKLTSFERKDESTSMDCKIYADYEILEYKYDCSNKKLADKISIKLAKSRNSAELVVDIGTYNIMEYLVVIDDQYYINNINANNRTYKTRVIRFNPNGPDTLFYNHSDGIVRLAYKDKLTWTILK